MKKVLSVLFVPAAETGIENITVVLTPVDFRTDDLPDLPYALPGWIQGCYDQIEEQLSKLDGDYAHREVRPAL